MRDERLKTLLKGGAIWGFILLELVFFEVAGRIWSLSGNAFVDLDNMLLLLKQAAPIGIIAVGMTVVMINGNIDLSVGATYALAGIVMLDSMSWPFMEALGAGAIPLAWSFALLTGALLGEIAMVTAAVLGLVALWPVYRSLIGNVDGAAARRRCPRATAARNRRLRLDHELSEEAFLYHRGLGLRGALEVVPVGHLDRDILAPQRGDVRECVLEARRIEHRHELKTQVLPAGG